MHREIICSTYHAKQFYFHAEAPLQIGKRCNPARKEVVSWEASLLCTHPIRQGSLLSAGTNPRRNGGNFHGLQNWKHTTAGTTRWQETYKVDNIVLIENWLKEPNLVKDALREHKSISNSSRSTNREQCEVKRTNNGPTAKYGYYVLVVNFLEHQQKVHSVHSNNIYGPR